MPDKAIVAGASGLIGSSLLQILLEQPEYDEVLALGRKELPFSHKKLVQLTIDFNHLENYSAAINGHALFCCLGSTRRKTPSLSQYRKVDFDYPVQLAKMAAANHMDQYHLVSSLGADAGSSYFYTKMKGETEQAVEQAGLKCLHIYQPSVLEGKRTELRLAERLALGVMKMINPLLVGRFKKYKSISASTVAMAMFKESLKNDDGLFIHPSDHIKEIL